MAAGHFANTLREGAGLIATGPIENHQVSRVSAQEFVGLTVLREHLGLNLEWIKRAIHQIQRLHVVADQNRLQLIIAGHRYLHSTYLLEQCMLSSVLQLTCFVGLAIAACGLDLQVVAPLGRRVSALGTEPADGGVSTSRVFAYLQR